MSPSEIAGLRPGPNPQSAADGRPSSIYSAQPAEAARSPPPVSIATRVGWALLSGLVSFTQQQPLIGPRAIGSPLFTPQPDASLEM